MRRPELILLTLAILAGGVLAQQLEPNDAGGSLTSNGANPVPGVAFPVNPNASMNLTVGGANGAPFILALGSLATTSLQVAALANQYVDLDLGSAVVVGDGIGGTGALPASLFILNGLGNATFSFPVNAGLLGQRIAFQAITSDATLPFPSLNLTAAPEFLVTSATTTTGDENMVRFDFPSGSYALYGQVYTGMWVSTNGWVSFSDFPPMWPDPLPTAASFLNGTPGNLPGLPPLFPQAVALAVLWDDLDYTGTLVSIDEISPGIARIDWVGGSYSPAVGGGPIGSITCFIDVSAGPPIITMDYTAFGPGSPAINGIVGISDGSFAGAAVDERDLVVNGLVNASTASNQPRLFFQDFSGAGIVPAEAVDISGVILNFLDTSANGAGHFTLF